MLLHAQPRSHAALNSIPACVPALYSGLLKPKPTTPACLTVTELERLEGLKEKITIAKARDAEQKVQDMFSAMIDRLCELARSDRPADGGVLHCCETSSKGYPMDPQHRIDILLSTKPKPSVGQVIIAAYGSGASSKAMVRQRLQP